MVEEANATISMELSAVPGGYLNLENTYYFLNSSQTYLHKVEHLLLMSNFFFSSCSMLVEKQTFSVRGNVFEARGFSQSRQSGAPNNHRQRPQLFVGRSEPVFFSFSHLFFLSHQCDRSVTKIYPDGANTKIDIDIDAEVGVADVTRKSPEKQFHTLSVFFFLTD
jgi:hypothetical protein